MATITPSLVNLDNRFTTATWSTITNADSCAAVGSMGKLPDKTIQVFGTFNAASVALHGSMDGTNFVPLTKNGTDAIAITAAGMNWIWENPAYIKPVITGGGATQSLTVIIGGSNLN